MGYMNEIDKYFYCSADCCRKEETRENRPYCLKTGHSCESKEKCKNRHCKHPTPEQFKEEYGEEYTDDWAVYCKQIRPKEGTESPWHIFSYIWFKENRKEYLKDKEDLLCVCACTPFGKSDDDWRPE
jgi:hypothetical protein